MSVIDLKYAKEGKPQEREGIVLALYPRGWAWGWAAVQNLGVTASGFFRVPDHYQGKATPHAQKCVMAFQHLVELSQRFHYNTMITEVRDNASPAASLQPVASVLGGSRYLQIVPGWLDELGLKRKELESWATVQLGKAPEDEAVSLALGLAAWWIRVQKRQRGEL